MPEITRWPRRLWWIATVGGLFVASVLWVWQPTANGFVLCLFRRVLELPCPGCGLTRATHHLLHGELGASMALHPLAPVLLAQVVAVWAVWGLASPRLLRAVRLERLGLVNAGLLVALWLGRLAVGDLAL